MIILELSDIQLTKQANSAGLLRWQACRKIEVTQGPSRTGSFSHSTQLVNSDVNTRLKSSKKLPRNLSSKLKRINSEVTDQFGKII